MTLQLSWDRTGGGPPIVLLHGLGTTRADFGALRPALEAQFDVLAPDLPGIGSSAALDGRPTVAAIAAVIEADLDVLGLSRVHLLGNSLGARVALELASRGRALSVVAISPSGMNVLPERLVQGLGMAAARISLRAGRRRIKPAAASRLARTGLLAELRAKPWRASRTDAEAMIEGFGDSADFWRLLWWAVAADVPARLTRIDVPVILAQGTADLIASGQTPRFKLLMPRARFVPLLGAGHAPQSDAPEAILRLVQWARGSAERLADPPRPGREDAREPAVEERAGQLAG